MTLALEQPQETERVTQGKKIAKDNFPFQKCFDKKMLNTMSSYLLFL